MPRLPPPCRTTQLSGTGGMIAGAPLGTSNAPGVRCSAWFLGGSPGEPHAAGNSVLFYPARPTVKPVLFLVRGGFPPPDGSIGPGSVFGLTFGDNRLSLMTSR